jgi:RHS repeat-associated protein
VNLNWAPQLSVEGGTEKDLCAAPSAAVVRISLRFTSSATVEHTECSYDAATVVLRCLVTSTALFPATWFKTNSVVHPVIGGVQRISQNQIISNTWTPSLCWYDAGGSMRVLTNVTCAVTDTYEYDAFGNEFTVSGSIPNNYLYRGEQYDSDLGLYYLRARYYNQLTGRFLSRDPKDGDYSDPATLHKYLYASADPVDLIDPSGRADLPAK